MEPVICCVSRACGRTLPEPRLGVHNLDRFAVQQLLAKFASRFRPLAKVHEIALEEALIPWIAQLSLVDAKNATLSEELLKHLCDLAVGGVSAGVRNT